MNTFARIALRNLSRQKKRSFLLGGAIAFGILIVTLINGFAGSFAVNVSRNAGYLAAGHIFISGREKTPDDKNINITRDDAALTAAVRHSGVDVQHITRRSSFGGSLIFEGKKLRSNISGIDFAQETFLPDRLILKDGSWDNMDNPQALILSESVAKNLNATIGDRIIVQLQTVYGQSNAGDFVLAGISQDSGFLAQIFAYANLAYVNELIGLGPDQYQSMGILLHDIRATDQAARLIHTKIGQQLPVFDREVVGEDGSITPFQALMRQQRSETWEGTKYRLTTINDQLQQMQEVIRVLDITSLVILLVLFAIVMIGITNTFRMIMFERVREIGTMRAVGIQGSGVSTMFLFEALFLALGGALSGIVLALIAMAGLSLINFGLDSPISLLLNNGHLFFYLPPARAVFNVMIIAVLTLFAASFPAYRAAKLSPAVALRTQN